MCQAVIDGGMRCENANGKRYRRATPGTSEFEDAARDYASTEAGRTELLADADYFDANNQRYLAIFLRGCVDNGPVRARELEDIANKARDEALLKDATFRAKNYDHEAGALYNRDDYPTAAITAVITRTQGQLNGNDWTIIARSPSATDAHLIAAAHSNASTSHINALLDRQGLPPEALVALYRDGVHKAASHPNLTHNAVIAMIEDTQPDVNPYRVIDMVNNPALSDGEVTRLARRYYDDPGVLAACIASGRLPHQVATDIAAPLRREGNQIDLALQAGYPDTVTSAERAKWVEVASTHSTPWRELSAGAMLPLTPKEQLEVIKNSTVETGLLCNPHLSGKAADVILAQDTFTTFYNEKTPDSAVRRRLSKPDAPKVASYAAHNPNLTATTANILLKVAKPEHRDQIAADLIRRNSALLSTRAMNREIKQMRSTAGTLLSPHLAVLPASSQAAFVASQTEYRAFRKVWRQPLSPEAHRAFRGHKSSEVRAMYAGSAAMSDPALAEKMAKNDDPAALRALAANTDTPTAVLKKLHQSNLPEVSAAADLTLRHGKGTETSAA